jgi:hypothetical protein
MGDVMVPLAGGGVDEPPLELSPAANTAVDPNAKPSVKNDAVMIFIDVSCLGVQFMLRIDYALSSLLFQRQNYDEWIMNARFTLV